MNELAKIFGAVYTKGNTKEVFNISKYNKYTNKTPKIFRNCKCYCHCFPCHYHCHHCLAHCQHNSVHNISCSKINNIKTMNYLPKYNFDYRIKEEKPKDIILANYKENNNQKIINNKSNTNLYQVEDNKIYDNESNHNIYIDNNLAENKNENDNVNRIHVINSYNQNNDYSRGDNNIIDNHKYHYISHKNNNENENKIQLYSR